ncbi:MAG: aminoacyl-tRNA hydrolase [Ferrimicrobium sp.]|uniref:aminoacyl-tRNA hydrolase n=1 Tax=Ferrimicrobium sp. TaxID=2926050 RepID=UPI0026179EEF|nr:aminoacyl-tRNA hydrolase [Ferrimicrobium sp.]
MSKQVLVVGLGNPGSRYRGTRHNMGFAVADALASDLGILLSRRHQGLTGTARLGEHTVHVLLPQTFMNHSGLAVAEFVRYSPVEYPEGLIVIHDELDLEPGVVRIKLGGGLAGHNGLKSIAHLIATQNFVRVRIGIGRPIDQSAVVDFVLARPKPEERVELDLAVQRGVDAVRDVIELGPERAMTQHNQRAR